VRPDVQGTNPITGKRDVIEIQSPNQNNDFMNKKIEILRNILGDDAGIVTWK
jgi:hypothetical protein